MRVSLLFGLVLIALASSQEVIQTRYHEAIGIPTAEKIRAYEEEVLKNETPFQRIVGGVVAPANAHPYFAGLLISLVGQTGNSVCGATLVSSNRLVTASHCWFDGWNQAWQFVVILGSNYLFSGGTRISTSQVVMHPRWDTTTLANDIAMVYLPTNVLFGPSIQPISLPTSFELFLTYEGMRSVAVGFGRTSDQQAGASSVLSHVNLEVTSNYFCQSIFSPVYVRDSTICTSGTGRVGICGGDSGGPLAINISGRIILIGVSSFVAQNNCEGGFPSAYSRVTSHSIFINQHL